MTITHDLLHQLRHLWTLEGRGAPARRAAAHLLSTRPDLPWRGADDLCEVVRLLEPRGGLDVLERAAIVQCLLEEAKDPWIARALLQTLLPGLVAVARQLRFGDGVVDDPGETVSVAVASLAELIHDWAGQSRPFAGPDLLSALRGRLRRWLLKEKRARADVTPTPEEPAIENSGLRTRLETLCTGTSERLARLTYARVFEGRSLAELAQADHSTSASLRQELRQFASRHLI